MRPTRVDDQDVFEGSQIEIRNPFSSNRGPTRPRARIVALPVEHGGWAFLLEPIVLGLLVAPSYAGLLIAISALALFLARHPLKLVTGDYRRRRNLPRTALAWRFTALYVGVAILFFSGALALGGRNFLFPLMVAAPLTCVQLFYDLQGRTRALVAEVTGAIATGAIATAIALAAGWNRPLAFGLWAVLLARTAPAILYVRARLKIVRGKTAPVFLVIAAHVLSITLVLALAKSGFIPMLAVAALAILCLRATLGLWRGSSLVTPKQIGFQEIGYGAMTVYAVALGQAIGW